MKKTVSETRGEAAPEAVALKGMIRKVFPTITEAKGIWGAEGAEGEVFADVPVYQQIGYYARPIDGAPAELILVNIGGDEDHPVIIASRDRSTHVEILADETVIFNSTTWVKITAGGEVLIASRNGTTEALVKKSEFEAHTHGKGSYKVGTDPVTEGDSDPPAGITGTTVLKAE